jgi:hypothetical protein
MVEWPRDQGSILGSDNFLISIASKGIHKTAILDIDAKLCTIATHKVYYLSTVSYSTSSWNLMKLFIVLTCIDTCSVIFKGSYIAMQQNLRQVIFLWMYIKKK